MFVSSFEKKKKNCKKCCIHNIIVLDKLAKLEGSKQSSGIAMLRPPKFF